MRTFSDGIWPVMLTPFQDDGRLDMGGLEALVSWYKREGCDGLFAVCQSSEMFFLTLEERTALARAVVQMSDGALPVIVSGHVSRDVPEQIRELCAMADTGADGLVLVTNRLVDDPSDDDQVLIANLRRLLRELPLDIPLGFYECPYPFKRLLTRDALNFCLDTGRFRFIKDTSCDMAVIREKLTLLEGSDVKLFNANTATLLDSLRAGAHGYTGVMANFHPALYRWMTHHWREDEETAESLQEALTMCALIELKKYPACAKRYLRHHAVLPIGDTTRRDACTPTFASAEDAELRQLASLSARWQARLNP